MKYKGIKDQKKVTITLFQIFLSIFLISSCIQLMPIEMKITNPASASSTWSQTNWSARINYSSLNHVDIIKSSGDLKLGVGQGLWVADTHNNRIVNTMMDGSGWTTYGTQGTGTGQFFGPSAINYDSSTGYIYVADEGNSRIIKTKIDGTGWTTYGSRGSGTGQFDLLQAIDFDSSTGFIYIADAHNNRIVKTKIDGSGWTTLGSKSSGTFNYPWGLDYDSNTGFIYIADRDNYRIVKTKIDGSGWTTYGTFGYGIGQFGDLYDIYFDSSTGYIYVTDYFRIVKTMMNGSGWTNYGSGGSGKGQFHAAWTIEYDNQTGYVYVCDNRNNRIVKTMMDGSGWTTYGTAGSGKGQFNNAEGLTLGENGYFSDGYLISKKYDFGSPADLLTLNWEADTPPSTSVKFQLRTANNETALNSKTFVGPNGSKNNNYTTSGSNIWNGHTGDKWAQYKVYLSTGNRSETPIVKDVTLNYNILPFKPTLTFPTNNSWTNDNATTFTWILNDTDSSSQSAFQWQMDDNKKFKSIDYGSEIVNSTSSSYTSIKTISDGIWYWRVRTKDSDGGWGPYSLPWMVQIDTQPPSSNISLPKNNGYYKRLDIIRGTAFDPGVATGVNRMELGIIKLKDNKYWDGSTWTSETSWLLANGTMKWEYNSKGVAWTSKEQYRILSRGIDNATNPETPGDVIIITFDTDCPLSTIIIPQNNSYHNALSSISGTSTDISGSGVKKVEIAIKQTSDDNYWNGQTWVTAKSWLNVAGTNEWIYDSSSVMWTSGGHYIIYARAIDWLNNIEVPTTGTRIIIDKDSPISQIIHPGEDMFLNQLDLITGNASDYGGSGLDQIEISIRRDSDKNYWDGATWQAEISWITAMGTNNWTYNSDQIPWTTDTYNTIFSNAIDKMGNKLTYWTGNTFMFDNKPPEQSFIINNNAKFTNSLDVNFTLESEDSGSGVALMTFSNDGQWSTWEPIDDYKLFNFSFGDGVKELYFKVQDRAGNIAEPATNSIILDTKPPECSIIINEDALYTKSYGVSVDLNATDELSGVDMMAFSYDHEKWTIWRPFKPDEKLTLPSDDGKKTVYFRVRDKAGNIGEVNDTIILDTIPPQSLSIEINNGGSETESKEVILNLHAIDKTSGLDQMSFSIKSTVWSDWEDYSNSTTFNLTAGSGEITIYFRVKDKAGNIANPTIDTITFNEPVQPKKTNQEQLDYWYLIIILIIIIIFTILAVVFKRKKKVPHKVPLVPAVTIKPKELIAPPMTVAKISAAPKIPQLPVTGAHLTSNLQQQPITQVTTSQPLPRLPPAFQSKPQSPVSITPTIVQTPSITQVSKVPIPGEQQKQPIPTIATTESPNEKTIQAQTSTQPETQTENTNQITQQKD